MNILIVGNGGREHALAWKLGQSPRVRRLYVAPGNAGTAGHNVEIATDDIPALLEFAREHQIDLTVVGPEAPLAAGIVDVFLTAGLRVFGPKRAAAKLEASKLFSKSIMRASGVPTADFAVFDAFDQALRFARALPFAAAPACVVKADGLAAGKGVVIAETRAEAEAALEDMFGGAFGEAGAEVVIEEFMEGEEASYFAITDGATILPFGGAQDHKRLDEGDTGPNTGGMGAYSPAPILTPQVRGEAIQRIIGPTVRALADAGTPYVGVLYAGLMLTRDGPKLVEYNCRFGDPECQVLMMRLEEDLGEYLYAAATHCLSTLRVPKFSNDTALTVVMAANGYPGAPEKGGAIEGIAEAEADGAKVFHAGTAEKDGRLVANGGRVLNVTAMAKTVKAAQQAAYEAVDAIEAPSLFCRRDIGWREVARQSR